VAAVSSWNEPTVAACVFLVDDFAAARSALREALNRHPGIAVVGTAASVATAVEGIRRSHPHVAVIDDQLPDGSGVDLCEILRTSDPSVASILYAATLSATRYRDAQRAGASAVLLKQIDTAELVRTILQLTAPGRPR
jgi:two-component system response regulator DevR